MKKIMSDILPSMKNYLPALRILPRLSVLLVSCGKSDNRCQEIL